MPLTPYQAELGRLLAKNRSEDSYLAGAAAILAEPNTRRYSEDLDFFHDTPEPVSLLELLRRRGKVRPEDLQRLRLAEPIDLRVLKAEWLAALASAEGFVNRRPPAEAGCLYYAVEQARFVDPDREDVGPVVPHFGRPGGVLPRILAES